MRAFRLIRMMVVALHVVLAPLTIEAQPAGRVWRIAFLSPHTRETGTPFIEALAQGLREHGYVEGQNLVIERRFAEARPERLPGLAAELLRLNVDVFAVGVNRVALAVQQVTTTIPIVMAVAEEPVSVGLVKSLARPGGNITGVAVVASPEIYGKNLELLRETLPPGARVAVLFNATSSINALWLKATEEAAKKLGVRLVPIGVRTPDDFDRVFSVMRRERVLGFVVLGEPLFFAHRARLNELALRNGLVSMWAAREGIDPNGLMSYGTVLNDLYRRAAAYVDRIFKGTRPGDLPMEQPTKFELVINLKTAKALGLTIPPSVLSRADEIVE